MCRRRKLETHVARIEKSITQGCCQSYVTSRMYCSLPTLDGWRERDSWFPGRCTRVQRVPTRGGSSLWDLRVQHGRKHITYVTVAAW